MAAVATNVDLVERQQVVVEQSLERRPAQVLSQSLYNGCLVLNEEAPQRAQLLDALGQRARHASLKTLLANTSQQKKKSKVK